jgi:S-(hydroxymethyl)glutathione dehydrogenase/alcohol dehydrogenase
MKCRAAVLHEFREPFRIEEVEVQSPGPREVLVKMAAAGICHSDWHVAVGTMVKPLPIVLGHEGSGTVVEAGAEVTLVRPGDRVILSWVPDCGRCRYCVRGQANLCDARQPYSDGFMGDRTVRFRLNGRPVHHFAGVSSFSEYVVVPESGAIPFTDAVPLDRAALFGCSVTTGVGAVLFTARVEPASQVAVFGIGGIGLNAIQGAVLARATRIFAVDVNAHKFEYARAFGATDLIDASRVDPVEVILEATCGAGVDYSFEAIGKAESMGQAFRCLRKAGTATIIGLAPSDALVQVPARDLVYGERVLRGSFYGSARPRLDFERMIRLYLGGHLKLDELVTRVYPLEGINEAYAAMNAGEVARSIVRYDGGE